MGHTMAEKIIGNHSGKQVRAGDQVSVEIDVRSTRDFGGAKVVKRFEHEYPGETVADPDKTYFMFDCNAPANTTAYATNQQICRQFAASHGIKVYDVDAGIGTHIMIDQALCQPSQIVVGSDSHMNILGSVSVLGLEMNDENIAIAFRTGKIRLVVPETIKVVINGRFSYPATAKDLALRVLQELGSKGARGMAIEFYGDAIERLSLDGRITLCSMVTEMGGITGFIVPNRSIIEHFRAKTGQTSITILEPDQDAQYGRELEIDITDLAPMASFPSRPDNVQPVSQSGQPRIHSVFVGSCTNGRYEDFKTVTEILKGKRVAEGVMLRMVPGTREIFSQLLKEGIIEQLFDAGAIISNPGCGGCSSGQIGITGKGEVQVSTANSNLARKHGAGDTYLTSPVTAAESALAGKLVSPAKN